jgi:hypothetical protein
MKIKKLIELLEKLPPNDEIEYRDGEWWCWFNIEEIRLMKCIEVKEKRMFSVWGYYTDDEEEEFEADIERLKSEWKEFSLTKKRVIK